MDKLRKYKKLILIILIFLAIISPVFKIDRGEKIYTSSQICYQNTCFHYDIADNSSSRQQGLMFRQNLPVNSGMLFIFPNLSTNYFRMKNTLIPLDIIRLDSDFKILYISHDTPPCETSKCPSYGTDHKSKYVLEINAGLAKDWNIGDKLILR